MLDRDLKIEANRWVTDLLNNRVFGALIRARGEFNEVTVKKYMQKRFQLKWQLMYSKERSDTLKIYSKHARIPDLKRVLQMLLRANTAEIDQDIKDRVLQILPRSYKRRNQSS